jgi:hypothetical protein
VVFVVLLAFAGVFVVGREMEIKAHDPYAAYPTSPSGYPVPYGTGPEWDKFKAAEKAGKDGYDEMQALMLSTDPSVAEYASHHLADSGDEKAFGLLYEQLPKVVGYVKDSFRTGYFEDKLFRHAAETVATGEAAQRDGALLFLKLPYSGQSLTPDLRDFVSKNLAKAVPTADKKLSGDLAFALGLYPPTDAQHLLDLLSHKSAMARKTAVTALGKLERKDALTEVQRLKSDPVSAVRDAAVTAELSIQSAVVYTPPAAYGEPPVETEAQRAKRRHARDLLGMP